MSDMRRENYPGEYSTPERCPVCHGPVEVDFIIADPVLLTGHDGRWRCPQRCDPRTLIRSGWTPEP